MSELLTKEAVEQMCPSRPDNGHKGTFGTALIVAGSRFMSGAQTMATMSALRSGCGMVRVYAPEDSLESTRINCPCALLSSWEDTESSSIRKIRTYLPGVSSCLIGPGLDEDDRRSEALLETVIREAPRLVIDAGALNIIAKDRYRYLPLIAARSSEGLEEAVLTPHIGEFRRLMGGITSSPDGYEEPGMGFAKDNGLILVLKSDRTLICDNNGKCYINNIGNSGMAKGGSGDVLAGLITGLMAQKMDPSDAACAGVYIHAASGDMAADDMGRRAMLPTDMPSYFGRVYKAIGWEGNDL